MKISKLLFLIFSVTLLFTACKKDKLEEAGPTTETETTNAPSLFFQSGGGGEGNEEPTETDCDALCFDFVYPVTLEMPDGTQKTANNDDELESIFEDYFNEVGENVEEEPELIFPIDVLILETNEQETVENEEDLIDLIDDCFEQYFEDCEDWEECFVLEFPITVNMPDGSTQTANDDGELHDIFENWFEANEGDTINMPEIAFPITVVFDDGSTQAIASEDELDAVFEECFGEDWDEDDWDEEEWDEDFECFTFVFPVQVNLPNSGVGTANSEEELYDLIDDWYEANEMDTVNYPTLVYPVTVDYGEGETVVVNSEDELEELLDECYGEDFDECFEINYPIEIIFPDNSTQTFNTEDELEDGLDTWYDNNPDSEADPLPVFPITVTLYDGTEMTLNNEEDLDAVFEECYGEDWDHCNGLVMSNDNQTTRAVMQRSQKTNQKIQSRRKN